jgi:hypothetical protein
MIGKRTNKQLSRQQVTCLNQVSVPVRCAHRTTVARSGRRMTTDSSCLSAKFTVSPAAPRQSNSEARFATKYWRCSSASAMLGQILHPAPNGIILASLAQVRSTSAPGPLGRNRSGRNRLASCHTASSSAMPATVKFTDALRHAESLERRSRLFRRCVRQQEVAWRVEAEPLQHDGAEIRHHRELFFLEACAAGDVMYLGPEPRLDLRPRHEVRHDPLQHRDRGVSTGGQEFEHKLIISPSVRRLPSSGIRRPMSEST